ncbi:MAG: hypothetical protein FWE06_06230 [Oscillospiraceae bacterium]|nr:hypothetical protein [Oscillospiraceae bacterium]
MDFNAQTDNIYHGKTKTYFQEVASSYYNGNYRAAIVVLYSVVITDIVYKLDELKNVYGEKQAADILSAIEELQKRNPKSAEWESQLIEKIGRANDFFDVVTHKNLEYLRSIRHLAAHPALDHDRELYTPNRDTVASCISNMLDGILTKPPIFIRTITDKILTDIASNKDVFINDLANFEKYMASVYLRHMSQNMIKKVFSAIWKMTFCLENEDCDNNRKINSHCLTVVMKRYTADLLSDIGENKPVYSNINPALIDDICLFICAFPEIYCRLSESATTLLQAKANSNEKFNIVAHFLSESIEEHLDKMPSEKLHYNAIKFLEKKQ